MNLSYGGKKKGTLMGITKSLMETFDYYLYNTHN